MTFQHVACSFVTTALLFLFESSSLAAAGTAAAFDSTNHLGEEGSASTFYKNELIEPNDGWTVYNDYKNPLPHTYITKSDDVDEDELPDNFNWGNVNGRSYLTHSLNQHIPQ